MDIATNLTVYAVSQRYPDDWREISIDESKKAVDMAEEVFVFVVSKLSEHKE